jgi:hypothetical protein
MPHLRKILSAGYLAVLLGAFATPVHASEKLECYRGVLDDCEAWMEDARWYEKLAIGAVCAGMLVGCAATNVF